MPPEPRIPPPRPLRSARVPTPGLRARFGTADGDLINVSVSGALIRTDHEVPLGSKGPVTLDLDGRRITLEGRVVRSVAIDSHGHASPGRSVYAVGVMFLDPAASTTKAVTELCGGRVALEELAYGILLLGEESPINELIRQSLVDAGYNTHVVRDARKALRSAKETEADLVIVDLKTDREPTSWWVLEAFAADPAVGGKSILALVDASSLPQERRQQLAQQRVRLLLFPFTPEELLTIVERALRESV